MSKRRSFRVSDDFEKKLDECKNYYRNNLGINYTNEQIFDEMVNVFYATLFMKNNSVMAELIRNEFNSSMEQFVTLVAKSHNAIIEEIRKNKK